MFSGLDKFDEPIFGKAYMRGGWGRGRQGDEGGHIRDVSCVTYLGGGV